MNTAKRSFLLFLVTSSIPIAATSGCSDAGDGTTESGAHGGSAGTAGSAGGHGGVCKVCGDLLTGDAVAAAELCGFQGHGIGDALLCEPGSSCDKFTDLHACMCGADTNARGACNDTAGNASCAMNACINGRPDAPCESCITGACGSALEACRMDATSTLETP